MKSAPAVGLAFLLCGTLSVEAEAGVRALRLSAEASPGALSEAALSRALVQAAGVLRASKRYAAVCLEGEAAPAGAAVDGFAIAVERRFRSYRLTITGRRDLDERELGRRQVSVLFAERIGAELAAAIADMAPPLARLERRGSKGRLIFDGAGGRPPGPVFRLLRRVKGQRRGVALKLSYFVLDEAEGGAAEGTVVSGSRRGGDLARFEEFAAPIRLDEAAPIALELIDLAEGRPLRGHQIYLSPEAEGQRARYLGVTDAAGRVSVRSPRADIIELQIRFNELVIARFPAAPSPDVGVLTLRLRRRPDQSAFHTRLNRVLMELEELLLLKEVAMEDAAAAVQARRYDEGRKILDSFSQDLAILAELERRTRAIASEAKGASLDLGPAVARAKLALADGRKRLDMTLVKAEIRALEDKVSARRRAQELLVKANAALARFEVDAAIALLERARLADPGWVRVRDRLAELEKRWAVRGPDQARARSLVLGVEQDSWLALEGKLDALRGAVTTLKRYGDRLSLERGGVVLTRKLGEINDQANAALQAKDLAKARRLADLAYKLNPILDEVSAYLRAGSRGKRSGP